MSSSLSPTVPKIALIHALPRAIDSVEQAFATHWPEVERINLVDDALDVDPERGDQLPLPTLKRFKDLTDYAVHLCAHGILYTCSAFGEAIEAARRQWKIPILTPNEAMFMNALEYGPRLGLVSTHAPDVGLITREFFALAEHAGTEVSLETVCLPDALGALQSGDLTELESMLTIHAAGLRECDAIMLADFALARSADAVRRATNRPVLAAPSAAVQLLRRLIAFR